MPCDSRNGEDSQSGFSGRDREVDLIPATYDLFAFVRELAGARFWAIQCKYKYHQDESWSLARDEAIGLIAGKNRAHGEFELGLICTTVNGRSGHLSGEVGLEYLMGDVWRGLGPEFFARLHARLKGRVAPPIASKTPLPHQRGALALHQIGDTPHDVSAARAIGAHCLAVATGGFTLEQLRTAGPDWAFENLAAPGAIDALLG